MQRVITNRLVAVGLAALMTLTAAGGAVAVFSAGGPGETPRATDGADLLVSLVRSNNELLWSSLAGNVATIETVGWPSSDGVHDLGGALMIERPTDPTAGVVDMGEMPKSVTFDFEG